MHDELLFDVVKEEIEEIKTIVLDNMCNAMPLPHDVPVVAELGVGKNWLEAH